MRRIARAMVVAVAPMVVAPVVADAEPMVLTASQMESVTAAALIDVNLAVNLGRGAVQVPTNVGTGDLLVQTNITNQLANAVALAFASCGVCTGSAPVAISFASAANASASAQTQQ